MLKKMLCLLAVLLLCTSSLAEPRYPAQSGVATDGAAVFSVKLLEDLRTLDKRLEKAGAPRLHTVTVDFLDASDVQDYANALFTRWGLPEDAVLLLLCVGEESYAVAAGTSARRLLPDQLLTKLLASHLHAPFLGLEYDAAIAAFAAAYANEASKACGTSIRTDDLFRSTASGIFGNWAQSLKPSNTSEAGESFLTREDKSSGFSLLKVLLIVVLLLLIFGTFRKGRKMHAPAAGDPPPKPDKNARPVYFKPREKKPTPQYFQPRNPRR